MPFDARPAYLEEEDDHGEPVRGTKKVASVVASKTKSSREGRSSKDKKQDKIPSDSGYSSKTKTSGSDASLPAPARTKPVIETMAPLKEKRSSTSRAEKLDRRASLTTTSKSPRKSKASAHAPSSSRNESTYYGQAPVVTHDIPIRPRPRVLSHSSQARPASLHGAYSSSYEARHHPPLSSSAYYAPPAQAYPPPSPSIYSGDSYFPPGPAAPMARPLAERFASANEPIIRSASAYGHKALDYSSFDDTASEMSMSSIPPGRSQCTRYLTRAEQEDYHAMPPPPFHRPSLRQNEYTLPPASAYSDPTEVDYEVQTPHRSRRDRSRSRRPSVGRHSESYDYGADSASVAPKTVRIKDAVGRRQSYHAGQAPRSNGIDLLKVKMAQASAYQDEVADTATPLTAETLRKQQKRVSKSSTHSSHSHDESDYKQSATTRTTRSGSGTGDNENITVRLTGQAKVMIGGAEIECADGAELSIVRTSSNKMGSERSSEFGRQSEFSRQSEYSRHSERGLPAPDDRKSHVSRAKTAHTRRSSVSRPRHSVQEQDYAERFAYPTYNGGINGINGIDYNNYPPPFDRMI